MTTQQQQHVKKDDPIAQSGQDMGSLEFVGNDEITIHLKSGDAVTVKGFTLRVADLNLNDQTLRLTFQYVNVWKTPTKAVELWPGGPKMIPPEKFGEDKPDHAYEWAQPFDEGPENN